MASNGFEPVVCQTCEARLLGIFSICNHQEIDHLNETKSCQFYKKGQSIFQEDHRPSGIFCVSKGKIKLVKLGNEGKEKIMRISTVGDLLGYKALIANTTYTATAIALEDSSVCFIPKGEFMDLLTDNRELSNSFTRLLCRNITEFEEEIVELAYKSVRERLAEALLLLRKKFEDDHGNGDIISITREDLANLVGTAKETVIRLLSDFKDKGIIESSGRKIVLKDHRTLLALSNVYD